MNPPICRNHLFLRSTVELHIYPSLLLPFDVTKLMGLKQRHRAVAEPFAWIQAGMVKDTEKRGWPLTIELPASNYLKCLLLLTLLPTGQCTCTIIECSSQYSVDTERLNGPSRQTCEAVMRFRDCVNEINPKTCRGDLSYHSTLTLIPDLINYNCAGVGTITQESSTQTTTESNMCRFKGTTNFRHCGLFGDPHLRTFDDSFLTCKAAGTWPLIFNEYLAVQVTNVPLTHGQGATATSKVIVIVKENLPCTDRKMYEVESGYLPTTFIDGSKRSLSVSISNKVPGEHIEIHIRHIATIIIVRQIGKYITFAIRMPEELIRRRGEKDIQLCVKGCPESERIDYADFLVQTRLEGKSSEKESTDENLAEIRDKVSKCRKAGVIDVYLDSCVFDLITTGDSNFTNAAQSALIDMEVLNPESSSLLHNRTSIFERDNVVWRLIYGNAAPARTDQKRLLLIEVFLTVLVVFVTICIL